MMVFLWSLLSRFHLKKIEKDPIIYQHSEEEKKLSRRRRGWRRCWCKTIVTHDQVHEENFKIGTSGDRCACENMYIYIYICVCVCFCIYRIFPCGANGQVIFCWCSWRVTEITRVHWHHESIDVFKYIFYMYNISFVCSQLTPIIEMATNYWRFNFSPFGSTSQAAKVDWRWFPMALQRLVENVVLDCWRNPPKLWIKLIQLHELVWKDLF